jgi:hypothetical protein
MRRLWKWFLYRLDEELTVWGVICWWEKRRIAYNVLVGAVGIASYVLFLVFITRSHTLEPGEDAVEPLALIAAPVLVNICYSGGAAAELFLRLASRRKIKAGPVLLKVGTVFSLAVVLLPSACWGGYLLWHTVH